MDSVTVESELLITTTEETSPIPTPLFSDYVEMAYLGFVLLIGVPINIHILFKLLKQKEKTARYSVKRGFLILKIHLNISDTLILFVNAGGKLGWLITYEWKGGEEMCRIFKYASIGTLYLSSNIVVCIALDQLRTVLSARQLRRENSVLPTKIIVVLAWLLALVSSLPQYFAFQSFDVLQFSTNKDSKNWYQCTDIWTVNDHLIEMGVKNATDTFPFTEITKNFHELFHLVCFFH
uniref:G-protein coupled receptors family 1 profile domain-containing protein n=1 Tax=Panagrolaimus davidi TaxID=227884 RepID=A0A914PF97_9BILA